MFFIANWKSYLTGKEAGALLRAVIRWEKKNPFGKNLTVLIAAPTIVLPELNALVRQQKSKIKLAAQDIGLAASGAYTGNTTPTDLLANGVRYTLVGHSERRQYFKEDDTLVGVKVALAQTASIAPILCVGETKAERQSGRAKEVVRQQMKVIKDLPEIIAYEPRWAIGTGVPIAPADAEEMQEYILRQAGKTTTVCYGGSVTPENILSFVNLPSCGGVLVGGASTKFASLTKMLALLRPRGTK